MEENRPARRRWFQFSLRTLLCATLLIGLGCAWVGMQLEQKRRHAAVVNVILKAGGSIEFADADEVPAWKEWLFGSYVMRPVNLRLVKKPQTHIFGTIAAEPEGLRWEEGANTDSIVARTAGMNVISLDLDLSDVTDAGLARLQSFSNLESLELAGTRITDRGLAHVKKLTGLKILYLGETSITNAGLCNLKEITGLERLFLESTQITDEGLIHLKSLSNLEKLSLSNSRITDAGLMHLKELTNLKYLDIDSTRITDAGLTRLESLTNLRDLDLSHDQITKGGEERLQQAMPDVFIFRLEGE